MIKCIPHRVLRNNSLCINKSSQDSAWDTASVQYRSVQKKRVQNAVLGYNLKDHRKISCLFWRGGKPFNTNVIQVYAPTTNVKEAEVEQFYKHLQDLLELTPKNRHPFHHRGLKCKSRKSRNTWRNRKLWPWSTK